MPHSSPSKRAPAGEAPVYVLAAPGTILPGKSAPTSQRLSHVLAISALLAAAPWHAPASRLPRLPAATFSVTNLNPAGAGSLRQAIQSANLNPGADTITFATALSGTINLTGTLRITDSVQIVGPGPGKLSVSGGHAVTVFYLHPGLSAPITATISGLTVRNGRGLNNVSGGIYAYKTDLTLDQVDLVSNGGSVRGGGLNFDPNGLNVGLTIRDSLITGNISLYGGGLFVAASPAGFTLQNSQVISNSVLYSGGGVYLAQPANALIEDTAVLSNTTTAHSGGGIFVNANTGPVTVRRTLISGNMAVKGGGIAFYKSAADTLVEDSTLAGNHSTVSGGGLEFLKGSGGAQTVRRTTVSGNSAHYGAGVYAGRLLGASLLLENTTISGNAAGGAGGGIAFYFDSSVAVRNSTIVSNTAVNTAGGIQMYSAQVPITNTIIAGNTAPVSPDIAGNFTLRSDLVGITSSANIIDAGGNLFGLDPLLGPLGNHGGPTQTRLPAASSPVINAGDPAFAAPPDTDQRGAPRVWGGRVDIGAVETVEVFLPLVRR